MWVSLYVDRGSIYFVSGEAFLSMFEDGPEIKKQRKIQVKKESGLNPTASDTLRNACVNEARVEVKSKSKRKRSRPQTAHATRPPTQEAVRMEKASFMSAKVKRLSTLCDCLCELNMQASEIYKRKRNLREEKTEDDVEHRKLFNAFRRDVEKFGIYKSHPHELVCFVFRCEGVQQVRNKNILG